jgi:predicted nucleic acid-binding protein
MYSIIPKEETQLMKVQKLVSGFPIILTTKKHHVEAAKLSNACRKMGIATSATGCLIAVITIDLNVQLLTTTQDFTYMQKCCNLDLLKL